MNGFRIFLIGLAEDLHFLRDHEGRIEAETEMTNNSLGLVFVFVDKFLRTGESDLVDVFVHLFCRHADTMIGDRKGLLLLINRHAYARIAQISFHFSYRRECL